jgi:serine/threonine protein phosphatase PrpC
MIYAYGITLQGTDHLKKQTVCQDNHKIVKCDENLVIAAVADGLGSEEYTDVASKLAIHFSTEYCRKNITRNSKSEEILGIIKDSFTAVQNSIERIVEISGHTLDQYDTTLSLAVLINDTLYYGHSGDSGIVALTTEGLYEKVTEQQRDEDDRVFPLFFIEKWVFGQFNKKVCGVFLATDGIYETLFPNLIRNEAINIHTNLASFFMDNRRLKIDTDGEAAIQTRIENFIRNIPGEQVYDDKTVVVLVNTLIKMKPQPDDYYKEPDWAELKRKHDEEYEKQAYPHLIKDKKYDMPNELSAASEPLRKENEVDKKFSADQTTNVKDSIEKNEPPESYDEYTTKEVKADKPRKKGGFWSWLLAPGPQKTDGNK